MSSSTVFWGIGDFLSSILTPLDADWGLTAIANTGIVILGFVGLFVWLSKQNKFNKNANSNPNQLK